MDPKKGGLEFHWEEIGEDIEDRVILGGDFENRFHTSLSRFQKVFQCFNLAQKAPVTSESDKWHSVRGFFAAVNKNLDDAFSPGRVIVADEIISSWHGQSIDFDVKGAPHITKIARKPEGIGVEMKALADGQSCVIVSLEIQEGAEKMKHAKYTDKYNAGTASVLRLTDSENIKYSGRTVIGDSAFDSVSLVQACNNEQGLYVMAAVKTAHSFFPLSYFTKWSKVCM